ncbi:hypothetical protein N0O92_01605 [Alkalihalobacillus sp. MEB130]|uniref:hypothetical protein n=1 Tax=Alkalihalobacillus sp. MEB130 TaxID=2976704 RepID=UPI0028DEBD14|nr:hypothetical protein [Alkalihalobacillus sp. MEB130]MDT8858907.1 hypothetical protein [Alkalihalobacillus sp. MEB130]
MIHIIFCISVVSFLLLHYLNQLISFDLQIWQSVIGLFILMYSLRMVKRKSIFPLFLLSFAFFILIFNNRVSWVDVLWYGPLEIANVIVLVLIIPMVGWVIKHEPYTDALFIKGKSFLTTGVRYFGGTLAFTQLLSHFLLVGCVPLMYYFANSNVKNDNETIHYLKNTSILRGFAIATLWVVTIPSFSYAVEVSGAPLVSVMIQGFIAASIAFGISLIFYRVKEKKLGREGLEAMTHDLLSENQVVPCNVNKLLLEFFLLFILFVGLSIGLHVYAALPLLTVVPLVTLVGVTVYFFLKKAFGELMQNTKQYFFHDVSKKTEELSIYFSVGIFIYVVKVSGLGVLLIEAINVISSLKFINVYMLFPFLMIILGFLGLGPLTSMILVGGLLQTVSIDFIPELFVLSITVGSAMSTMLSPVSVPVVMISSLSSRGKWELSVGNNWVYSFIIYMMAQMYILVWLL